MNFNELNLSEDILKALNNLGYKKPSEVQEASIPRLLNGEDVVIKSQTGSGKTASFGIPVCEKIDIEEKRKNVDNIWKILNETTTISNQKGFQEAYARYKEVDNNLIQLCNLGKATIIQRMPMDHVEFLHNYKGIIKSGLAILMNGSIEIAEIEQYSKFVANLSYFEEQLEMLDLVITSTDNEVIRNAALTIETNLHTTFCDWLTEANSKIYGLKDNCDEIADLVAKAIELEIPPFFEYVKIFYDSAKMWVDVLNVNEKFTDICRLKLFLEMGKIYSSHTRQYLKDTGTGCYELVANNMECQKQFNNSLNTLISLRCEALCSHYKVGTIDIGFWKINTNRINEELRNKNFKRCIEYVSGFAEKLDQPFDQQIYLDKIGIES